MRFLLSYSIGKINRRQHTTNLNAGENVYEQKNNGQPKRFFSTSVAYSISTCCAKLANELLFSLLIQLNYSIVCEQLALFSPFSEYAEKIYLQNLFFFHLYFIVCVNVRLNVCAIVQFKQSHVFACNYVL